MKFKKIIIGYIIGFNMFGLIGCTEGELGSMLSDIADAKMEEYKKSDEYKYGDHSIMYLVECPKCGSELTCTDEWCMENEEDRLAYEEHQANYRLEQEKQDIYNTCNICGYKQSEGENRVKRYILGGSGYRLCDEASYDCVYKQKKELGLAKTSTDIKCEWCKGEADIVHNTGRYEDIDSDNEDEYFHELCYGRWYEEHKNDKYFITEDDKDDKETNNSTSSNQYIINNTMEPNMVTCDHCGRQGELYENITRWYDTNGNNNFTHAYCIENYIKETGKEPAQDLPNLK